MSASALADSLRRAAHPLDAPPAGEPWNLHELDGLLSPGEPRPAAVLVGIVAHAETPTVLLTRRHEGLRHHAGQVSFPGGRIEAFVRAPRPPRCERRARRSACRRARQTCWATWTQC
jgi:hypothetical protein